MDLGEASYFEGTQIVKQLNLPISLNTKMLWRYFIGDKNQQIIAFLSALFDESCGAVVYVFGNKSSGKTHLLQGCAFTALERLLPVVYIDFKQDLPDTVLDNLEQYDWVCIDNVDNSSARQQQDLFDFYNRIRHKKTKLIISGSVLANELNLFKDLKTRLSLATTFSLELLNDAKKKIVIEQQAKQRNLQIDLKIYDYLFKYYSRDLTVLLSAINQLDEASLQQKNKITIPLVKQILKV